MADGQPVYPFVATPEKLEKCIQFFRNFPLSTNCYATDQDLLDFMLHKFNIFLETENALLSFEYLKNDLDYHVGFVFLDKIVTGREKFLRDVYRHMIFILRARRFTSYVTLKNRVMWRMLEKVGFTREGNMRDAFQLPDGAFTNVLVYGILAEELEQDDRRRQLQVPQEQIPNS